MTVYAWFVLFVLVLLAVGVVDIVASRVMLVLSSRRGGAR